MARRTAERNRARDVATDVWIERDNAVTAVAELTDGERWAREPGFAQGVVRTCTLLVAVAERLALALPGPLLTLIQRCVRDRAVTPLYDETKSRPPAVVAEQDASAPAVVAPRADVARAPSRQGSGYGGRWD